VTSSKSTTTLLICAYLGERVLTKKAPLGTTVSTVVLISLFGLGKDMERFEVKRGIIKSMNGNAGLAKLATEFFNDVEVNADGVFNASFAILTSVTAEYTADGKLQVDVEQMKGDDLSNFLSQDGGREQAMQSRSRWSNFLDQATGYSAKQRGDKAKEQAKKFSKARSAIKMAHKSIEMSSTVTQETIDKAHEMIAELEKMMEEGTAPSEGRVKKLNDLL
tara:strand:+ start:144 stop:803 length:660 start_codon:yes stop_codon:yes gene_type:complete